jgi:23S rRNA pseudouridine2605 synthase
MGFMPARRPKERVVPERRGETGRRVQLHRALSKLGWGSRTQAWNWIREGEVAVDGRVVTEPLTWVDLERQQVTLGGRASAKPERVVLALHKPAGIVTTRSDERGRQTVYDLLPAGLPWLFPAGRLDADSEGLLIFTNDAKLAERLTAPELHVPKTYEVTVRGVVTAKAIDNLCKGVELADGRTQPCQVRLLEASAGQSTLEIILTEGRNRQIRRMMSAVGHKVRRLVRVAIGNFPLGNLTAGDSRALDTDDVRKLGTMDRHRC